MSYALITGGSKGIGKAIAIELAKKKYDLILIARYADELQKTANEIAVVFHVQVKFLAIDLSLPQAPQQIFDWCNKNNFSISILINNAGFGISGAFEKYTANDHCNMLQVNINALLSLCSLFLPQLKKLPQAYILNIASTAAYQAVPGLGAYSASKAFVKSFSRSLSYELRKSTVSVTCVSPGGTSTDWAIRANIGEKGLKMAKKLNMTATDVAIISVNAMFAKKTEIITGAVNIIGAFLSWLLPKKLVEGNLAKIYEG